MMATVEKPLAKSRLEMQFFDWTPRRLPQRPNYEFQSGSSYVHSIPTAIA